MNIRRLRTVAGFQTQNELADLLGISPSQLSEWENDRHTVLNISSLPLRKAPRRSERTAAGEGTGRHAVQRVGTES